MNKFFAMFLTLCVSAALIGCGEAKKEEKKPAAPAAAPAKAPEGEKK